MEALATFMAETGLDIYDIFDGWDGQIIELLETGSAEIEHNGQKVLLTATSTKVET